MLYCDKPVENRQIKFIFPEEYNSKMHCCIFLDRYQTNSNDQNQNSKREKFVIISKEKVNYYYFFLLKRVACETNSSEERHAGSFIYQAHLKHSQFRVLDSRGRGLYVARVHKGIHKNNSTATKVKVTPRAKQLVGWPRSAAQFPPFDLLPPPPSLP